MICESRIEVPDIPESYKFTGAKKKVTPNALTAPAIMRSKKFLILNLFTVFPYRRLIEAFCKAACECVTALVIRVAVVTAHPDKFDVVFLQKSIELFPKIIV